MHNPTLAPAAPDPALPGSASPVDPARAAEIRRQLRGLALALFAWTSTPPDSAHSTASERMLAMALRPMLPRLRDALLSRLDSVDGAALEAMLGATSTALESMIFYAPGEPGPRYVWSVSSSGAQLVPAAGMDAGELEATDARQG